MTTALIRPIRSEEDLPRADALLKDVDLAAPSTRDDQGCGDIHTSAVSPVVLSSIRELTRSREDMLRIELRNANHAKAVQRRIEAAATAADHSSADFPTPSVSPAAAALLILEQMNELPHAQRLAFERALAKLAKELPAWPWVESVRGFGPLGFALIIGECGDLNNYANPAKVWKRMSLSVEDGERQRLVPGGFHGYVPRRRSLMWTIGDSLIKGNRNGVYRTFYILEKERQREKLGPDAPQAHVHNRAQRHMEKLLLKHLWQEWRAAT